jgi:SAM-dependent methyltransferase
MIRSMDPLPLPDLEIITTQTLGSYSERADAFWEGTRDHDVSQNINALLSHIVAEPPFQILDFGCGPGRDLKAFADHGHMPVGLDGTPEFIRMARDQGFEAWEQNFLKLDLPICFFDGIFANASIFHVPRQELPRVLGELWSTLKPRGVLFSSNPRGDNQEGWNNGRYGAYHDLEEWRTLLGSAGFIELGNYYRPAGLPRNRQNWLATIWRRR